MDLSRRELLKLFGATGGGALAGTFSARMMLSVPDPIFERVLTGPRLETWKASVCSFCPAGCGIRVRLIDEIPVRVTGNPLHPVNQGAICPMAEAGIEDLFHSDRVKEPLRRVGRRGENSWERVSWEEALDLLASRLEILRNEDTPEKLIVLTGHQHELLQPFLVRFMTAFGSPHLYSLSDHRANQLPILLTQGVTRPPVYDLAETNFVLNFGADLLDGPPSPVRFNRLYGGIRGGDGARRVPIVHFSSYLSRTASNASDWVPVQPGTLGALALSIAHVLIQDGTYDVDFVNNRCFGFLHRTDADGKRKPGFRNLVLHDYYPEKVSGVTGVSAERIVNIAREFGRANPALVIWGSEATHATNGLYTGWAIHCLNALKGNLNQPGGILFSLDPITADLPPVVPDATARAGLSKKDFPAFQQVKSPAFRNPFEGCLAGLEENPDGADTLILARASSLFRGARHRRIRSIVEKVPFVVSCVSHLDETVLQADLVLPEPSLLERWEGHHDSPGMGFRQFSLQQPVLEPIYDTHHVGDIVLQVARKLGLPLSSALPWDDYVSYLVEHAKALFNSGQGAVISETTEPSWEDFLRQRGWQPHEYTTFDEFWEVLIENGGWWDPQVATTELFETPSGRFEFYSQTLEKELQQLTSEVQRAEQLQLLRRQWKIEAKGDAIFLPLFELPRSDRNEAAFPLVLMPYSLLSRLDGAGQHLSLLQELSGLDSRIYWRSWAEINPETAHRVGIQDHDDIYLVSPRGSVRTRAHLSPAVMPGVVMVPAGVTTGPDNQDPFKLFSHDLDLMSGVESLISTRVRIEKADDLSEGVHTGEWT